MIPAHKCTAYCAPDDGIHCIPEVTSRPVAFEFYAARCEEAGCELLRMEAEADVSAGLLRRAVSCDAYGEPVKVHAWDDSCYGYLVWVREKNFQKGGKTEWQNKAN